MKIHVYAASARFTGGRKVLFNHVNELARRGHDVTLWIEGRFDVDWMPMNVPVRKLDASAYRQLPQSDVCLFDRPRLARWLWSAHRGPVVHFCQGFERLDVDNRLAALLAEGPRWRRLPELWKLWRKRREIEQAYQTPTVKMVVHAPLRDLLARLYGQQAYLVPNGLPTDIFTPAEDRGWQGQTILAVGSSATTCKRIGDVLEAVRVLKKTRPGVCLIRVAAVPISPEEEFFEVTDEYYTMLIPTVMVDIYRRADVLAIPSDANEGFGLPALEAMACGTPVVMTDIPAFRSFAPVSDYAHFVPVGRPDLLAEKLGRLLDDQAERSRLSRRGPEVAAAYSLERSYQAMEDALTTIVAQHRSARAG